MTYAEYRFINWYLSSDSSILDGERNCNRGMLADFVSEALMLSGKEPVLINANLEEKEFNLKKFVGNCRHKIIEKKLIELIEIVSTNKAVFYDVLVHGSFITNDYSLGWSDLDALVILKNESVETGSALTKTRSLIRDCIKILRQIDPLCHHEFQIVLKEDLKSFPTHWLPQSVIEASQSILGRKTIKIFYADTSNGASKVLLDFKDVLENACSSGILDHHPWRGSFLMDNFENCDNGMYQLKYLLSVLVLMPAIYYTQKGIFVTKPEGITAAKKEFKDINWGIIDKATEIRASWPIHEEHPYQSNEIPDWVKKKLGSGYFQRSYDFINSLVSKL
jgi:hypothetical protein